MILNIYKEYNWTSFDVVRKLRGVLGIKKIGHAGTLDPLAEGVLIILTEKDTKKQDEIMKMSKEYLAEIAFGATSESYDLEQPLEFNQDFLQKDVDLIVLGEEISDLFSKYIGEIKQKVPAHSAVKVKGKKLYEKARKGTLKDEEIPTKTVIVYDLKLEGIVKMEIQDVEGIKAVLPTATIRINCGKGFYVRSFANDLGKDLDIGAVLTKLTRTKVGNYSVEDSKLISSFSTIT